MSKSNNIVKWGSGNDVVDSGISITSIGSGGVVADSGLISSFSGGTYSSNVSHSLGKVPKIINFNNTIYANGVDFSHVCGNYCNGNNKCLISLIQNQGTVITDTTYCIYTITTAAQYIKAYVSAVSSSNFTLTYNNTSSVSSLQGHAIWSAIG
jgi:hypothetical protein